mmetsp:Transcript_4208/g.8820  ORF Transcript_4208/g.8820 Transcript_4208/m.8820 type:complete len:179 (+) Transcript_4208:204-740(+)
MGMYRECIGTVGEPAQQSLAQRTPSCMQRQARVKPWFRGTCMWASFDLLCRALNALAAACASFKACSNEMNSSAFLGPGRIFVGGGGTATHSPCSASSEGIVGLKNGVEIEAQGRQVLDSDGQEETADSALKELCTDESGGNDCSTTRGELGAGLWHGASPWRSSSLNMNLGARSLRW